MKYVVIKKEGLTLKWAINRFHYYLWGQAFDVVIDHMPLKWVVRMKDRNPSLMQFLALQLLVFTIHYWKSQPMLMWPFFPYRPFLLAWTFRPA